MTKQVLNTDYGTVVIVYDKYGDGMWFRFDITGRCYEFGMIGHPTFTQEKQLIKEYENLEH